MLDVIRTAPILRSFSEADAKAFYVGFLGFAVDFEHRFEPHLPLYMAVSRAGLTLHISEHRGDAAPHGAVYLEVTGLHAFHAELAARAGRYEPAPIRETPWNTWCVDLVDPSGNRLSFNERRPG